MELDISNAIISENGLVEVGEIVKQCEVDNLVMINCQLTFDRVGKFMSRVNGAKMKLLNLRSNSLPGKSLALIASIISEDVRLILEDCDLSESALREFMLAVGTKKIKELNISETKISDSGFAEVGEMVKQCRIDILVMRKCNLTDVRMEKFASHIKGAKLSSLDLRENYFSDSNFTALSIRRHINAQYILFGYKDDFVEL